MELRRQWESILFIYLFLKKEEEGPRVYFRVELSSAAAGVSGVEPRRRGCCAFT